MVRPGSQLIRTAAFALLVLPAATALAQVNPGKVSGDARFTNASAAPIAAHLSAHPVIAGTNSAVRLVRQGQLGTTASAPYTPVGGNDPLASYEIRADVEVAGTNFFIELSPLKFQGDATYRFGSRQAAAPAAVACGPVTPESSNPAGSSCPLAECAALVSVEARFTGPDIDALDALQPVICIATASVEDVPGSGMFSPQAVSAPLVQTVANLQSGTTLQFLVRADGTQVRIRTSCTATPAEEGFIVDPATGFTAVSAEIGPTPLVCGGSGGAPSFDQDLEVRKRAGGLIGLFDLAGRDESAVRIQAGTLVELPTPLPFATPVDPAAPWEFEGVPVGDLNVRASALIDSGGAKVEFPRLAGPNGQVTIVENATTDLGRTFVALPRVLPGRVVLSDPSRLTELSQLTVVPFTSLSHHATTFVEARGSDDSAAGGASGHLGVVDSVVTGAWDAAAGEADLGYALPLVGIAPRGMAPGYAPLDGSAWLATPWDVDLIHLHLAGNRQESVIRFGTFLGFIATAPQDADDAAPAMPEQRICFGEHRIELQTSSGTLHTPGLAIAASNFSQPQPGSDSTPFSYVSGNMQGTPLAADPAVNRAEVVATLPAGLQYTATPRVTVRPAGGGSDSVLNLDPILLPESGDIGCGAIAEECIQLEPDGETTRLSIGNPDAPLCSVGQQIATSIPVHSDGLEVDAVETALDAEAYAVHCISCGIDPVVPFTRNGLPAGPHLVHVRVSSGTCSVEATFPVELAEPFSFACPANLVVALGAGETSIPRDDPRVAPAQVATTTGGCGETVTVEAPGQFLPGENLVEFTGPDGTTCSTTVTVGLSKRHLAFSDDDSLKVVRIDDGQLEWQSAGLPLSIQYDASGTILGVRRDTEVTTHDAQTGVVLQTFSGPFTTFAFRPTDSRDVAFIMGQTSPTTPSVLRINFGSAGGALAEQAISAPPVGADPGNPVIAWSPDGQRIAVASNVVSGSNVFVHYREWELNGTNLGQPVVNLQWNPLDWQAPAAKDMVIDLALLDIGTNLARMMGTTNGLYNVNPNLAVPPRTVHRRFVDFDLSRVELAAAVVWEPSGTTRQIGVISEGGPIDGPVVDDSVHSIALRIQGNELLVADAGLEQITIRRITNPSGPNPLFTEMQTVPARNLKKAAMAFRPPPPP